MRLRLGQRAAEQHRHDRERCRAREHPRPRCHRQHQPARRRRERGGRRHHHRVDAQPAPQLVRRVDRAQQRRRHAQRRRRAERLRRAHHQQERQALGEEAEDRRDREQRLPELIEAPESDPVAERREGQQRHHQHQLIDRHHQHRRGGLGVEIARDGGERDGGDRAIDHHQCGAERDRGDGGVAAGEGQAVGHGGQAGQAALGSNWSLTTSPLSSGGDGGRRCSRASTWW